MQRQHAAKRATRAPGARRLRPHARCSTGIRDYTLGGTSDECLNVTVHREEIGMERIGRLLFVVICALLSCTPFRSALATAADALTGSPVVRWTVEMPEIGSDLSELNVFLGRDGTIYAVGRPGNIKRGMVYAISREGELKWKHRGTCSGHLEQDGTVYIISDYGHLLSAVAPSGEVRWEVKRPRSLEYWDSSEDGTICAADDDGTLCAVAPDGQLKWEAKPGRRLRSLGILPDGTICVSSEDKNLYAVTRDGQVKWKCQLDGSPVRSVNGTMLLVGSGGRYLSLVGSDGRIAWTVELDGPASPGIALGQDGSIYVCSCSRKHFRGCLYAVTPQGQVAWKTSALTTFLGEENNRGPYTVLGFAFAEPLVAADGTIYMGPFDPHRRWVHAFAPDGQIRWKVQTDDDFIYAPVLGADGSIYVSAGISVYAFGPDGALRWKNTMDSKWNWASRPMIGPDGTLYVCAAGQLRAIAPDGHTKWELRPANAAVCGPIFVGADGAVYVALLKPRKYGRVGCVTLCAITEGGSAQIPATVATPAAISANHAGSGSQPDFGTSESTPTRPPRSETPSRAANEREKPEVPLGAQEKELLDAVGAGDTTAVERLLKEKADINAKGPDGSTPLHRAAKGRTDLAELLVASGADVNTKDSNAWTPLHVAVIWHNKDVVEFLLTKGAEVNTKARDNGRTPLHEAAMGHKEIVELLVAKGAEVNARDNNGWTPLHLAVARPAKDVVELLLAKGADINVKDNTGRAPLHVAAEAGCKDVAELLLAKGAEVNVRDNDGKTPLRIAEDKKNDSVVRLLREHGGTE